MSPTTTQRLCGKTRKTKKKPGAELNVRMRWKHDARSGHCFSSSFTRSKTAVPAKAGKETGNMGGGEKRKMKKRQTKERDVLFVCSV